MIVLGPHAVVAAEFALVGYAARSAARQTFLALGNRLVVLAEHAQAFRRMDMLDRLSQILVSLPLPPQYAVIGSYYEEVCTQDFGRGDLQHAASLLERVVENAPTRYRIRGIISLGANSYRQSDYRLASLLYNEARRFSSRDGVYDPYVTLSTQRMVGVSNGIEGNHRDALALLENLFQFAHATRSSQPHVYYDYMNSFAVELCEVGRLEEAKNVSQIVHASPLSHAYPEWREARTEIELRGYHASHATVAVSHRTPEPGNLVRMPVPERQDDARRQEQIPGHTNQQARVIDLLEWKMKMGKEPNSTPQDKKNYKGMDGREMLLKIMELTGSSDRTDDELERILEAIDRVLAEPKQTGRR